MHFQNWRQNSYDLESSSLESCWSQASLELASHTGVLKSRLVTGSARVSLALLSLSENEGLIVVYLRSFEGSRI